MRVATVLVGAVMVMAAMGCDADQTSSPTSGTAAVSAPAPATSAQAAANTLAFGRLLGDGGPRAGVPVFAVAWPKSEILDRLKPGADVPTKVVARAMTDANGIFRLQVNPSQIDLDYVEDGGDVQMEIVVEREGGPSHQFIATQGEKGWSTADATGEDRPFEAELRVDQASGELKVKRLDTGAAQG